MIDVNRVLEEYVGLLQRWGHRVQTASSGLPAVQLLQKSGALIWRWSITSWTATNGIDRSELAPDRLRTAAIVMVSADRSGPS